MRSFQLAHDHERAGSSQVRKVTRRSADPGEIPEVPVESYGFVSASFQRIEKAISSGFAGFVAHGHGRRNSRSLAM